MATDKEPLVKTTEQIINLLVEKLGEEDFLELNDYLYTKAMESNSEEFSFAVEEKANEISEKYENKNT